MEFLKHLNTDFFIFISGSLNNIGDFQLEKTWLHLELQDFEYVYLINQKQVRWYFDGIQSIAASYLKKLSIGQRGQASRIDNELSESAAHQGYIIEEYDKDLEIIIDLVSDLRSALRSYELDPSTDYDNANIWWLNATDFQSAIKGDNETFKKFFHVLLNEGIYIAPSAYESWFITDALSYDDLDFTINAISKVAKTL
jgi:hypothetical protein